MIGRGGVGGEGLREALESGRAKASSGGRVRCAADNRRAGSPSCLSEMEGRAGRREIDRSRGGSVWCFCKTPSQFVLTSGKPLSRRPARGGFLASECFRREGRPRGPPRGLARDGARRSLGGWFSAGFHTLQPPFLRATSSHISGHRTSDPHHDASSCALRDRKWGYRIIILDRSQGLFSLCDLILRRRTAPSRRMDGWLGACCSPFDTARLRRVRLRMRVEIDRCEAFTPPRSASPSRPSPHNPNVFGL